jgi:hypothetical protein
MRRYIPFHILTTEQLLEIALKGHCTATEFQQICTRVGISQHQDTFHVCEKLFADHPADQRNIDGGSVCRRVEDGETRYHLYWSGRSDEIVITRQKTSIISAN